MQHNRYCFFIVLTLFITLAHANVTPPARNPFYPADNTSNTVTQSVNTLKSCWIPLYFANAKTVSSFISKKSSGILSNAGKINYDKRSNQLWIKDDAQHIAQIKALIKHLDQPEKQFLIKAKIITVDRQYQRSLGILFHTTSPAQSAIGSLSMNTPTISDDTGQFTFSIAKLGGDHLLNLQISALEQAGHASLISSPALTTLDSQPAVIESGAEVPYQEATSSGATNVDFKKAVLRLKVTPKTLPNNHILLHIALNQDKVSQLTVNGVPAIETQQITTQVIVQNNQTIVLGGILETSNAKQNAGIPIADHIPVVGQLFTHHEKSTKQLELLIFITPSMIKGLY